MTGSAGTAGADGADVTHGCVHEPDPDTAYGPGSLKANLRYAQDGPVDAKCLHCGQWIRCENYTVTDPAPAWSLKYPEQSCTA